MPIAMPMRTHIMLQPPEKAGGAEKIFHIYEEWGGNQLITAKTTKIPYLGKIHANLRRFTGQLIVWFVDKTM